MSQTESTGQAIKPFIPLSNSQQKASFPSWKCCEFPQDNCRPKTPAPAQLVNGQVTSTVLFPERICRRLLVDICNVFRNTCTLMFELQAAGCPANSDKQRNGQSQNIEGTGTTDTRFLTSWVTTWGTEGESTGDQIKTFFRETELLKTRKCHTHAETE